MGFSPLANMAKRIPDVGRSSPRNQAISGFTIHHNAGVDAYGQATAPGREVSANYWITNAGEILPNIDENLRAWTSGSPGYPAGADADHRNITVEVSNSPEGVNSGSWAISGAAMDALIRLIADVYTRYGLGRVTRGANRGVGIHSDWVPTACPGPYITAHMTGIVDSAERVRVNGGGTPTTPIDEWEKAMKEFKGGSSRSKKQVLRGGVSDYVTFKDSHDQDAWGDRTIARGPGYISGLEINLTLSGPEDARAAIFLVKETGQNKNRTTEADPRMRMDSLGRDGIQIGFSGYLREGELLRLMAKPQDGVNLTVESFYWKGLNRPGGA